MTCKPYNCTALINNPSCCAAGQSFVYLQCLKMSSVPFYAINTSCRTAECPHSPFRVKKPTQLVAVQQQEGERNLVEYEPFLTVVLMPGRSRSYSASETLPKSTSVAPSSGSPVASQGRCRSLDKLDNRTLERIMDTLSSFN